MSGKALVLALAICGCTLASGPPPPAAAAARAQGAALVQACEGRDGWSDPAPPARIHGNTYYVGTCGITAILIRTDGGDILIDTGPADAAASVLANIRALGFDPRDIHDILFTHEHFDHMGGLAAMANATGATVWSSAAAKAAVEAGSIDRADPQFGIIDAAPPAAVGRSFARAGRIGIGGDALALTALPTPGHTAGGTSWSWKSCDGAECITFAFVASLSAVGRDDYRFVDHPERVAPFRQTFVKVAAMDCDILITAHPAASDLHARLARTKPLRDADACRAYSARSQKALGARLIEEAGG